MRLPSLFPSRNAAAAGSADPAAGVWLITFTDLIGLMLAFFIMMYAMSALDQERWRKLASHLGAAPASEEGAASAAPPATAATEVPAAARGRDTGYLAVLLPQKLAAAPALARARIAPGAGHVDILIPHAALLEAGSAALSPSAGPALDAIGAIIANLPNAVRIEAHMNGRAQRPQDWTEAATRAAAVASALAAAGYPRPLEARGYVAPLSGGTGEAIAIVILE